MDNRGGRRTSLPGWVPVAVAAAAAVVVVVVAVVVIRNVRSGRAEEEIIEGRDLDENQNEILKDDTEEATTEDFVIFGVDTRADRLTYTRSDSIMIVHIDYEEETIKIASIYRDCLAYIEGYGYEKINHAHWYGGPELALETINDNYDLDISKYMTLNFNNVIALIDEIGGVEMDITDEEVSHLAGIDGKYCGEITEEGTYLLDGAQALAYSRIRHAEGGDYRRAERQRDVLISLLDKAKTLSTSDVLQLAEDMLAQINSNYRAADLSTLLYNLAEYDITETMGFPRIFYGGWIDGVWLEVPTTLIDMNAGIHEFLFGETVYTPSEEVKEYSEAMQEIESVPNTDQTGGDLTGEYVEDEDSVDENSENENSEDENIENEGNENEDNGDEEPADDNDNNDNEE